MAMVGFPSFSHKQPHPICEGSTFLFTLSAVGSNGKPLELIVAAIEEAGYAPCERTGGALDPAASGFYGDGVYRLRTEDGRPVLLGITERFEFVVAPGHVGDLKRYRARGYTMKGNWIRLVTDRPMEIVKVHPPLVNSVDMAGITVEFYPPRPPPVHASGFR